MGTKEETTKMVYESIRGPEGLFHYDSSSGSGGGGARPSPLTPVKPSQKLCKNIRVADSGGSGTDLNSFTFYKQICQKVMTSPSTGLALPPTRNSGSADAFNAIL